MTLLSYLMASLGMPMPAAAAARKDRGQPFPCQDHPCGCQTAEQCWQRCCCFSPEERFAWAREHNMQPPSYAEKPTGNGWQSPRQRDLAKKPCCSSHVPAPSQKPSPTCCQSQQQPCCESISPEPEQPSRSTLPKSKNGKGWVLGVMALQCQGHSTLWASSGSVLPPRAPLTWNPWPVLVDQICLADEFASHLWITPLDPPPRLPLA